MMSGSLDSRQCSVPALGWRDHGLRWSLRGGVALAVLCLAPSAAAAGASWTTFGQNPQNSRHQASESVIGAANAGSLAERWRYVTAGDVSATPALDDTTVYFPDSAGNIFAVDRRTGSLIWKTSVSAITGFANDYARATPALAGSMLVIGTQSGKFQLPGTDGPASGAWVLGLDKRTGALRWKTQIERHFSAIVTQSAQVNGSTAYVGTASNEEAFANRDLSGGVPYTCCSFRGSVSALDVMSGKVKWKTYTVPDEPGYSGAAVWGSAPAVDERRGALYIATGNNYSLPADRSACVDAAVTPGEKQACLPGNHFDAIMALDLRTGGIRWSFRALPYDAWNTDCGLPGFSEGNTNPGNCPPGVGPDYDFGQAPMLFSGVVGGRRTDLVGAGSKSGEFFTLDRNTGAKVWSTVVGAGGLLGGLQWGSATDGRRIYVAESNSTGLQRGAWSALDVSTGDILWETPDPNDGLSPYFFGYSAQGPVSVANGLVYGCTLHPSGTMLAMSAQTGEVLWKHSSGSSCIGGAAIADGTVYWGHGYRSFAPLSTPGNTVFAFTPGGR